MSDDLNLFVRESLARGISRESIQERLLEARWPQDEVESALAAYADVDFPVPVPRPKAYVSAKEAFVYLVLFTTLYTCAFSLIQLLFQFINQFFPDPAASFYAAERSLRSVRWSTAALLIAFPIFLWLSRRTHRAIRRDPEKRLSKIRKWLTYLTLFAAAGALLADLITLVFTFLDGELTVRFLLKVLAVGAVAGTVFGYYLWDLNRDDAEEPHGDGRGVARAAAVAVSVAVVASIIGGLFLAGSPHRSRALRFDDRREQDLQGVASAIDSYWSRNQELPEAFEALAGQRIAPARSVRDPESGALYEYRVTGERTYELCATFALADTEPEVVYRAPGESRTFWSHGAGRECFALEVWERD